MWKNTDVLVCVCGNGYMEERESRRERNGSNTRVEEYFTKMSILRKQNLRSFVEIS